MRIVRETGDILDEQNFKPMNHFTTLYNILPLCTTLYHFSTFSRLGRLASDLGPHLSMLAVFRTHLEKSSLDESVTVDPVKHSAAQFLSLSNTHFPDIKVASDHVTLTSLISR